MLFIVLKKNKETENIFSLILEKPKGFNFYPGQYIDIGLPVEDEFGNTRAFTISSSPTENFLMITPKIGVTPFKKFMEKLKKEDVITSSHPAGTFTLDESSPAVFIAGGIGITPFRSMIKYVLDMQISTPITLIYSVNGEFAFKNELDIWQKQLPNLTILYLDTSREDRLNQGSFLKLYPIPLGNAVAASSAYTLYPKNASSQASLIFYLAGSHSFVDNLENILLNLGIDQTNIRTDRFDGY